MQQSIIDTCDRYKVGKYDASWIMQNIVLASNEPVASMKAYQEARDVLTPTPIIQPLPKVPAEHNHEKAVERRIPPKGRPINLYSKIDAVVITEKIDAIEKYISRLFDTYNRLLVSSHGIVTEIVRIESYYPRHRYIPDELTIEEVEELIDTLVTLCDMARRVPSVETFLKEHVVPYIDKELLANKKAMHESGIPMKIFELKTALLKDANPLINELKQLVSTSDYLLKNTLTPALTIMKQNLEAYEEYYNRSHFYAFILPEEIKKIRLVNSILKTTSL